MFVGTTQLSIHRLYRRRLSNSFGVRRDDDRQPVLARRSGGPARLARPARRRSDARRLLRPAAQRHRTRRAAGGHVHDLEARGAHGRRRHVDRQLPVPAARRPQVRARGGVVDGDVRRRVRLGDGPAVEGQHQRADGRAQHRPRHLAAEPAPHARPGCRVLERALRLPVQGDPRLVRPGRPVRVRRRRRALGQPRAGRAAAAALLHDRVPRCQRRCRRADSRRCASRSSWRASSCRRPSAASRSARSPISSASTAASRGRRSRRSRSTTCPSTSGPAHRFRSRA